MNEEHTNQTDREQNFLFACLGADKNKDMISVCESFTEERITQWR